MALTFLFNPFSGLSPLYPLFVSPELPLNKYPVPTTPDVQLEGCCSIFLAIVIHSALVTI